MPLVFSPLTEQTISTPPRRLYPRHAFVMRQLGDPPELDREMADLVADVFVAHGISTIDADGNIGGGDYLERILGLIRSTGFTVAVFSEQTRPTALANIALELGFAAMCGKPLVVVKSRSATAPSDLKRTDWIDYDPRAPDECRRKLVQAVDQISDVIEFEYTLLTTALEARNVDCAVAFERVCKGWLLSGEDRFLLAGDDLRQRLQRSVAQLDGVDDLNRLFGEMRSFLTLARR